MVWVSGAGKIVLDFNISLGYNLSIPPNLKQKARNQMNTTSKDFGVRYSIAKANGQIERKEAFFSTPQARSAAIKKLEAKDNFIGTDSYCDPRPNAAIPASECPECGAIFVQSTFDQKMCVECQQIEAGY